VVVEIYKIFLKNIILGKNIERFNLFKQALILTLFGYSPRIDRPILNAWFGAVHLSPARTPPNVSNLSLYCTKFPHFNNTQGTQSNYQRNGGKLLAALSLMVTAKHPGQAYYFLST